MPNCTLRVWGLWRQVEHGPFKGGKLGPPYSLPESGAPPHRPIALCFLGGSRHVQRFLLREGKPYPVLGDSEWKKGIDIVKRFYPQS